jgi:hypothetical protein
LSGKSTGYTVVIEHLLDAERQISRLETAKEDALRAETGSKGSKKRFKGKCFYCKKEGHKEGDCKTKLADEKVSKGPSTGPLATPSGGKGLSPPPDQARVTLRCVGQPILILTPEVDLGYRFGLFTTYDILAGCLFRLKTEFTI